VALVFGVDVGASKCSAVVLDDRGELLDTLWLSHSIDGVTELLATARLACEQLGESHGRPAAVGVSVAGWLDAERRRVTALRLGLADADLHRELEAVLTAPVRLLNDGDATLLGECAAGCVQARANLALLSLGTAVAGAAMVDGRLIAGGPSGTEFGHLPVLEAPALRCPCGSSGCLELIAGGQALRDRATELRDAGRSPWLSEYFPEGPVSARELGDAMRAGDSPARDVIAGAADAIASAARMLIAALSPEAIVFGGSVMDGLGDLLVPLVRAGLASRRPLSEAVPPPELLIATLGPNAAAIGAAQFVLTLDRPPPERTLPSGD
jgi:glucokinase